MSEEFTVDYFINKFESIPLAKWCIGEFDNGGGQKCALGYCGAKLNTKLLHVHTKESIALTQILRKHMAIENDLYDGDEDPGIVYYFNDGSKLTKYLGDNPKDRVINALKEIKNYDN